MTKLERLAAAPEPVRAAALELLDEVSAPLTPRDLDRAFQNTGMSRAQARRLTASLKHLAIVAIGPR